MPDNAFPIPDHLRPWSTPWPGYTPIDITPPELQPAGIAASLDWAEQITDPTLIDFAPRQAAALVPYDVVDGRPRNPAGRTGLVGRNLGVWGEKAAADAIVITADAQVLLILRDDCYQWALPGGGVESGEDAQDAAIRELAEETGVVLSGLGAEMVSRGYVADPRATDEAWICSTAMLLRVPAPIDAVGGTDALEARWFPCHAFAALNDAVRQAGSQLYPPHVPLLTEAIEMARRPR